MILWKRVYACFWKFVNECLFLWQTSISKMWADEMKLLDSLRHIARVEKEHQERIEPKETNSPPSPEGKKARKKKGQEDHWSVSKSCQCVGRVPRIPSFKLLPKFIHLETYYRAWTSIPSTLVAVGFGKLLETMLRCHYLIPTIICVYCIYRCSFHATLTAIGCYAMYFYRKEKSWYMTHWMKGGVD